MSVQSPRNVDHRCCSDVHLCCLSALWIKLWRKRVVYELYQQNINSLDMLLPSIQKKCNIDLERLPPEHYKLQPMLSDYFTDDDKPLPGAAGKCPLVAVKWRLLVCF